jgi:predicted NAD/FAD-binding protein
MRIAVVGAGVAGLYAAWRLARDHDVTVFEANDYPGGHTNTVDVEVDGRTWAVDTGFIVFNDWTYPNFIAMLEELGVEYQPSNMSFSLRCERSGLEYNGTSLNSLFAQRLNALRPSFLRMIADILRFNARSKTLLGSLDDSLTLGEGWHNNHHRYPMSVRQGFYWWEVDITYYLLRGLAAVGLIWDLKPVPREVRDAHTAVTA